MADTKQPPLADTKTYIEEQGLSDAITSALVKVLAEKPADAKRRLVEHLSGSDSGAEQSVPFSVHAFEAAKGGCDVVPATTAVVFIEYQNEFATEGGKLYDAVKPAIEKTDMLNKSASVAAACRKAGAKVMLVPIMFKENAVDNPNQKIGILAGCADGKLFTEGTWNAEFCDQMKPQPGDIVITGKKGLDAFPHSDLEQQLVANKIETVVLGGFLANCCVESTMRTAYEKGFNTITLTDCVATTDLGHQEASVTGSYGMFSTPMTAAEFEKKISGA